MFVQIVIMRIRIIYEFIIPRGKRYRQICPIAQNASNETISCLQQILLFYKCHISINEIINSWFFANRYLIVIVIGNLFAI